MKNSTTTRDTTRDTVELTTPMARLAVWRFGIDRDLPLPLGVRRPSRDLPTAIVVDLSVENHEKWVEATGAGYHGTETMRHVNQRYVRVSWVGKVSAPIGEIAVVLRILQRVDLPTTPASEGRGLSLVPGGAA